jgi:hypothetical protein
MHELKYIALILLLPLLSSCNRNPEEAIVPEISFTIDRSFEESAENNVFEFPVVLDKSIEKEVSVNYKTQDITATAGEDYIATSGTLTFEPGTASQSIFVEIIVDDFIEEDEEFKVILTTTQNGVLKGGTQEAIGTIENDDRIPDLPTAGYSTPDSYPGKSLVWSDEFDGTAVNRSNWGYDLGSHGWGNAELQNYTSNAENSYQENGKLYIAALKDGNSYTSARLKSQGLKNFQYGRIDIRALLPEGQGIWPALWMLGHDITSVGWPACGEIDIMELIGSQPSTVHGTIHYGADWSQHEHQGTGTSLSGGEKFADAYHVFSIEWDANGITWYLDDKEYYSIDTSVTGTQPYPFDDEFFFIMNVAVGGRWPGYPNATTTFPQYMVVDYVRVFQ